jgi:hypothetical protein
MRSQTIAASRVTVVCSLVYVLATFEVAERRIRVVGGVSLTKISAYSTDCTYW